MCVLAADEWSMSVSMLADGTSNGYLFTPAAVIDAAIAKLEREEK